MYDDDEGGSSLGEEMMIDSWVDYMMERTLEIEQREDIKNKIWTMIDGKTIKVEKMETSHIKNCINMLLKNDGSKEWIKTFVEELVSRIK